MTKSQLIERIAHKKSLLTVRDVEFAVKVMLDHMATRLAEGGRIEIRGFGSISLHFRPAGAARNPKTGTPIVLPARYAPCFRPTYPPGRETGAHRFDTPYPVNGVPAGRVPVGGLHPECGPEGVGRASQAAVGRCTAGAPRTTGTEIPTFAGQGRPDG